MDDKEPLNAKAQAHEGTLRLIKGLNLQTPFRNCTVRGRAPGVTLLNPTWQALMPAK